jgi:Lytic polysaccharide mono-oxygenase, cellulose-degrading
MSLSKNQFVATLAALVLFGSIFAEAHIAMMAPKARQVVKGVGLIQNSYTSFGGFGDVYGNNANIFGGPKGEEAIKTQGYEVCGDDARRKAFSIPSSYGYAPTEPQMIIEAGSTFEVMVRVTAHHFGWFEFRLCAPNEGQKVVTLETPSCFKKYLLPLAPDQYYTSSDMMTGIRSVFDYEGTAEAGYNFQHAKCQKGPPDTCCDADSGCSPENANVHRFMLPRSGVDNNDFRIKLIAPNVVCDRCTLQVTYRTGNSPDSVSVCSLSNTVH